MIEAKQYQSGKSTSDDKRLPASQPIVYLLYLWLAGRRQPRARYTVEGKRVANFSLTGGTKIFIADVSSLAKGVYIYSLKQQNAAPATGRLVKM